MHVTVTALVTTATDLKQLRRAAELIENASNMTGSLKDLIDLHLLAEDAKGSLAKLMKRLDPDATGGHAAVGDAAGKEG